MEAEEEEEERKKKKKMFPLLERIFGRRRGRRRPVGLAQNFQYYPPQGPQHLMRSSSLIERSSSSLPRGFPGDQQHIGSSSALGRSRSLSFRPLNSSPPSPRSPASPTPELPLQPPPPLLSLPLNPQAAALLPYPIRRPRPLGEVFLENLVVFWDMENCRLSKNFKPKKVYDKLYANLTSALRGRVKFQHLTVKAFGASDYLGFNEQTQQALRECGIEYTDTLRKEDTDDRMIRALNSWVQSNGYFNRAGLVGISGDKHFQVPFIQVRSFGHITINVSHFGGRNVEWETMYNDGRLDYIVAWRKVKP